MFNTRVVRSQIIQFLNRDWIKFSVPFLIFVFSSLTNIVEAKAYHSSSSSINSIDPSTKTFILGEIDKYTPIIEERRDIDRVNILDEGDEFIIRKPTIVQTEFTKPDVPENLPRTQTITHTVKAGETFSEISENYGLKMNTLLAANQNLKSADSLAIGDEILIPAQDYDPTYAAKLLAKKEAKFSRASSAASSAVSSIIKKTSGASQIVSGTGCIKPVGYHYVSRRLQSGHFGIDMIAPTGTPIYASCAGKIITVAGGWSGGFGLHVKISQDNGDASIYGHMSTISKNISSGQYVEAGTYLGEVGSTGRSTGPHLHFEVRRGGRPIDYGF